MAGFRCPFCDEIMSVNFATQAVRRTNFDTVDFQRSTTTPHLELTIMRCPNDECRQHTISARGMNGYLKNTEFQIYPQAIYEHYPDYVPEAIRSDYEEACKIVDLSPKAAATLARRCLQGMIRDFWNIHDSSLSKEIKQLESKVPSAQWCAIDAVRRIGNIGAHMEHDVNVIVDIDPGEAEKLLTLIEHLIESWYIERHDAEELYADLIAMGDEKFEARKG